MPGASLAPLLALAGHCFVGEVGPGARDTHCFTAMFEGQHVRDSHRVEKGGRIVYQGETAYSVQGGTIAFTYLTSIGGIGRGTAKLAPREWRFSGAMRATPRAAPTPFTARWQWRGADRYLVAGTGEPVPYRRVPR